MSFGSFFSALLRLSFSRQKIMLTLPIDQYLPELLEAIKAHDILLVIGDTGSGKSTRLPKAIYESFEPGTRVVVTQPRRVAAMSVAERVSSELNVTLGREVGYSIRFDDRTTEGVTRLRYVTDGVLLREAMTDPLLSKYDIVILDEAHERSLDTDILFGLLKKCHAQRSGKDAFRLIVMSATLHVEKFSAYFYDCLFFNIVGKTFPVDILYEKHITSLESARNTYLERTLETVLHIHLNLDEGDILVFLTGHQEIENACSKIMEMAKESESNLGLTVLPLYAALDIPSQKRAFMPAPDGSRKIVFSTNIAATSVTIENIKYVVDCGFVKQKMFDPKSGMDSLLVVPISQSAATQRSGRAGRTGPGKSFRLYSRNCFENEMDEDTVPEIQRTSLVGSVLQLLKIGIRDILSFDFMDRPDENCLKASLQQLYLLDAITENAVLTEIGLLMSRFPLSPFLSRSIIAAARDFGCLEEVATIVSMLSVEDPWIKSRSQNDEARLQEVKRHFVSHLGDHLMLLNIYKAWQGEGHCSAEWCKKNCLHQRSLVTARAIRDQVIELCRSSKDFSSRETFKSVSSNSLSDLVLQSFSAGFYMNCARKNMSGSVFYQVASNFESSTLNQNISDDSEFSKSKTFHFLPRQHSNSLLALYLHPSCCLLELSTRLGNNSFVDCVIYHEIINTQRSFMKSVSIIKFEWIQTLLEKLKSVGTLPCLKLEAFPSEEDSSDSQDKLESNPSHPNDEKVAVMSRAEEARERYLKRRKISADKKQ